MALLEVKNLNFRYHAKQTDAISNLTFEVNKSEFVVICGKTGCGKTTLLKLLKKEIAPTGKRTGDVFFSGKNINELSSYDSVSKIAYLLQNPHNQIVTDKVWHELAFGLENLGIDSIEIRRRVGEMANFFGINTWFRQKTDELSGGQKQILNLASLLVMHPKLILLDEPTSQLDPIAASDFLRILERVNKELGITVILVEHRLEEVFSFADRVMVLERGEKIVFDTPQKVAKVLSKQNHEMINSLPSSIRIFHHLNNIGNFPLTIREGKVLLEQNYSNEEDRYMMEEYTPQYDNAIRLENIWFRYSKKGNDILSDLNLIVPRGEILSIIGGNGSGKTTLLHTIAGLLTPYEGTITINQKKIKEYKNNSLYLNNLTLLPQNPQDVFLKSTVKEDLYEALNLLFLSNEEKQELFEKIVTDLDIKSLLFQHPYDLSGGEQQKAALAKVLLLQPKILLLDEPTKGLDSHYKQSLVQVIKKLKEEYITVVIVTHDIEFAALVSDQCAMLFDGTIISKDKTNPFFSNNTFYTTSASRISRGLYQNAITVEQVVELAEKNGVKK